MTRARDLADSADKDIAGTLTVDDITASGTITGDTAGTHTGAVTGNVTGNVTGDLTGNVIGDVIDEANLKVSNAPTNGYFLSAQSGNTGGLTWATPPSGYADSDVDAHLLTAGVTLDATNDKLGINSTSPLSSMHVKDTGSDNGSLRVGGSGASLGLELLYDQSGATTSIIQSNPTYTSASQLLKIRADGDANPNQLVLDGSGNVLVGSTSSAFNTDAKIVLAPNSDSNFTNNGQTLSLNRTSTDGDVIGIYKDASGVGSIGVSGGNNLYVSGTASNHAGVTFATQSVLPTTQGTVNNNTVDIGQNGNAFKDLYLGGGAYLGGTGSANYLEDYEEGTFTATLVGYYGSPSTTVTSTGQYTKVGNQVSFWINMENKDTTGASGNMWISGLPFASSGNYEMCMAEMARAATFTNSSPFGLVSGTIVYFYSHASAALSNVIHHNAGTGRTIRVSGTYRTS